MSYRAILAQNYSAAAEFARALNSAVIEIKKASMDNSRTLVANEGDFREACSKVVQFLSRLLKHLGSAADEPGQDLNNLIPADVLERLQKNHKGDHDYFVEDLTALVKALKACSPIDQRFFRTLDEMAEAADASASLSFRRLWGR